NASFFRCLATKSALHQEFYLSRLTTFHKARNLRKTRPIMDPRQLSYGDGPMVWVDCEMTGLDPDKDKILEIAWCTKQHGQSGLTQACLDSPHSQEEVSKTVLEYIKKWVPQRRVGILAGNSVHADRAFLVKHMPEITDWLHYRSLSLILNVRFNPNYEGIVSAMVSQLGIPKLAGSNHRALDDIRGSIKELQWYRRNIFMAPTPNENTKT
ncbi:oligoribonuclease, partial [Mycena leptocephala]